MKLFFCAALALLLTTVAAHAVPVTVRVADAAGRPIGGVTVEYADYADITKEKPDVGQIAKTAADGTLSLDLRGVSGRPNEVIFQLNGKNVLGFARVRDAKLGYAVTPMIAGENTLTMRQTSRVQGVVTDANGAPVAGAQVTFVRAAKSEREESVLSAQYGLTPIVATTKTDGTWALENLLRGQAEFMVSAPGWVKEYSEVLVDNAEITAPTLKMRPAGIVRGRVLDFGGQPVSDVLVYLSNRSGAGPIANSDAQGRFEMLGVDIGESALEFSSSASNWTGINREIKVKIPAQNAVVDIGDVRADEGFLLSGSVVDDVTQAPIAGVKLKLSPNNTIVQTDAQGRFETRVGKPYYGLNVVGAYTEKSVMVAYEAQTQNGEKYDVGTIQVERLGATFRGRVVDEKGAPIPNARVGWNYKSQFQSVAPDEKGEFAIQNLPFKPLQIRASYGLRFNAATAAPDVAVTLKLAPATAPFTDAEIEKMWDELKIKSVSELDRYFEALGNSRVFAVARRLDAGANPAQIGAGLDDYLRQRALMARTPNERTDVALEGLELLRRANLGAFSSGMAEIAVLAARADGDEELRAWAGKWYDAQKKQFKPLDSPDKVQWYDEARTQRVLQVGAALERDDAVKYRDIWLRQIDKPNNKYIEQFLPEWGETLWSANPKWFDEIVGQWPPLEQMAALKGALKVEQNAATSRELLARLEKLSSDPAVVTDDVIPNSMSLTTRTAGLLLLNQGRINYARAVAAIDAPRALDTLEKLRETINDSDIYQIAAIIARQAIADGQPEVARRALKLGLQDSYSGGSGAPTLALIARDFDADLAAQLMEIARRNATVYINHIDPTGGWGDVATYAIALREFDTGTGRLQLEKSWLELQQKFNAADREFLEQQRVVTQEKLAWAMAFYDVPRALQWLGEIKDERDEYNNGLQRTRLSIQVVALTPLERRYLLLSAAYFQ